MLGIKFTDQKLQTYYNGITQQYTMGEWVTPSDGQIGQIGEACGPGSLHLMKKMHPLYAPYPYLAHKAEGEGMLGEDAEKARFRRIRLLRTYTDGEIDQEIDKDWEERLGQKGLFLPIAWARTPTFLDRPVDQPGLTPLLQQVARLLGKSENIRWIQGASLRTSLRDSLGASLWASLWASQEDSLEDSLGASLGASMQASLRASLKASLWDSLGASMGDSLWASLWASLFYERGFALENKPKPELTGLLEVWKAGVCPLGWSGTDFIILCASGV